MNKASGVDGILVELFQILKDDAVKVLHLICQQIWKTHSAMTTGLEKVSFHSNPKERQCQRMLTLLHNYTHFTCYKVILKILQARLQSTQTENFQMYKMGFEKEEKPEIKLPTFVGS